MIVSEPTIVATFHLALDLILDCHTHPMTDERRHRLVHGKYAVQQILDNCDPQVACLFKIVDLRFSVLLHRVSEWEDARLAEMQQVKGRARKPKVRKPKACK